MNFWEKIKKDLQKGIKEGLHAVKGGVTFVKGRAEALTEEGKKRYKVYEIKTKVQKEIAELGGQIYDLDSKVENPMQDSKVREIIDRINKLETRIAKLEEKPKAPEKAAPKKPKAPKKTAPKKAKAPKKAAPVKKETSSKAVEDKKNEEVL